MYNSSKPYSLCIHPCKGASQPGGFLDLRKPSSEDASEHVFKDRVLPCVDQRVEATVKGEDSIDSGNSLNIVTSKQAGHARHYTKVE